MNPSGAIAPQKRPDPRVIGISQPQTAVGSMGSARHGDGTMVVKSERKFARWVLAASVGMAVVIGCAGIGAQAADDDDDALPDVKILRGVMKGLGLRKDEASIDYRERSPLVLPPSKELPSPESSAAKAANWPDDPDLKQVRKRKEAVRDRKPYVEGVDDKAMLPSDYDKAPPRGSKGGEAAGRSIDETSRPASAAELGTKSIFTNIGSIFGAQKEEYTTFSGEPPRASLTEPPPGYRTPSPNQPYGVGKDRWQAPKIDRQEPVR
jgi:hypothetical protein